MDSAKNPASLSGSDCNEDCIRPISDIRYLICCHDAHINFEFLDYGDGRFFGGGNGNSMLNCKQNWWF